MIDVKNALNTETSSVSLTLSGGSNGHVECNVKEIACRNKPPTTFGFSASFGLVWFGLATCPASNSRLTTLPTNW